MSVNITVQPASKRLTAATGETVLDSALRAGLAVKYNCSNGSCGQCKARLVKGELGKESHHDFHFKDDEKSNGYFLMCSSQPATDLEIEVDLIGDAASIPEQEIETRVYKLDAPRDNIRIVQLRTPRSQTLQFLAGQYVTLHIEGLNPRSKSIASCPCNGMYLQFHFNNEYDDAFAEHIFNQMKTKDKVLVKGPYGRFVFDEESVRPVIFIANDTGFAPIKSLVEHVIALEVSQPIHLYWLVKRKGEDYLANYCHSWEDALDNFIYTNIAIEEMGLDPHLKSVEALEHLAQRICLDYPDLGQHDLYLSGPQSRYQAMLDYMTRHQLNMDRVFVDSIRRY